MSPVRVHTNLIGTLNARLDRILTIRGRPESKQNNVIVYNYSTGSSVILITSYRINNVATLARYKRALYDEGSFEIATVKGIKLSMQ